MLVLPRLYLSLHYLLVGSYITFSYRTVWHFVRPWNTYIDRHTHISYMHVCINVYKWYQYLHYLLSLWLMTHRITTILHPEASTSHIFFAGTQMAIRGLGTKAKITTKITAPQMAKFFTNSSSMIPTSADVFFFRVNSGWEDFIGFAGFSEKESFRYGRLRSPWIFWFGLYKLKKRKRFFSG